MFEGVIELVGLIICQEIKTSEVFELNYDAVFEDAFRNRSSSFSVVLPRSACAILSIVSVYKITILASDITDQ